MVLMVWVLDTSKKTHEPEKKLWLWLRSQWHSKEWSRVRFGRENIWVVHLWNIKRNRNASSMKWLRCGNRCSNENRNRTILIDRRFLSSHCVENYWRRLKRQLRSTKKMGKPWNSKKNWGTIPLGLEFFMNPSLAGQALMKKYFELPTFCFDSKSLQMRWWWDLIPRVNTYRQLVDTTFKWPTTFCII